jgi:hypothetical protein
MENYQLALLLFLRELGIPPLIDPVYDRRSVQHAVYLGQAAGVNFNYDFTRSNSGPISSHLTVDYYAVAGELISRESSDGDILVSAPGPRPQLKESAREIIALLKPIVQTPEGFRLPPPQWLELLASIHYLKTRDKLDSVSVRSVIASSKPFLINYLDRAIEKVDSLLELPTAQITY